MYYLDATILTQTAELLGKEKDAQEYSALAEQIRQAFNEAFFNDETNWYADGMPIVPNEIHSEWNHYILDHETNTYKRPSQASQALPLDFGLVPPDRVDAVAANLAEEVQRREYVTTADVGHRSLLRALSENGRSDLVNKLHNRTTIPGYGWQIEQGQTALAEAWDGRSCASLNHGMLGHIQEWFHADVLGIQCAPDAVAFRRIVIRPQIVGDLTWARGEYDSIRGTITVDWRIEGGKLALAVTIPPNTSAMVYVPTKSPAQLLESGKPVAEVEGVTPAGAEAAAAVYRIESGSYVFHAPWDSPCPVSQ
jgi:hypothetical protein